MLLAEGFKGNLLVSRLILSSAERLIRLESSLDTLHRKWPRSDNRMSEISSIPDAITFIRWSSSSGWSSLSHTTEAGGEAVSPHSKTAVWPRNRVRPTGSESNLGRAGKERQCFLSSAQLKWLAQKGNKIVTINSLRQQLSMDCATILQPWKLNWRAPDKSFIISIAHYKSL